MKQPFLKMPNKIEAQRIVLMRPYPPTFKLAKEIFEKIELSRSTLRDWLPWVDKTKRPEDNYTVWLVGHVLKNWEAGTGFAYIIRDKETKALLGAVDLMGCHETHKSGEIGYWMSDDAVGHGYMSEAVRALESEAFRQGINRIIIRNDTRNTRSANVAKRCGYQLDGIMRQDRWDERWQSFVDSNVWSKLKSDWEAEQKIKRVTKNPCNSLKNVYNR